MEGVAFQAIILQHIGAEDHMKLQDHLFTCMFRKSSILVCLIVSRVSLMNGFIFAVFPKVMNLLCKLPCVDMVQRPFDPFYRTIEKG